MVDFLKYSGAIVLATAIVTLFLGMFGIFGAWFITIAFVIAKVVGIVAVYAIAIRIGWTIVAATKRKNMSSIREQLNKSATDSIEKIKVPAPSVIRQLGEMPEINQSKEE